MQNIQLPDDQFQRLSLLANAAGYNDVQALIASLVDEPVADPRGELSDACLRESVAKIEQGEAEIDRGSGRDMKTALLDIARKHGLDIQR